MHLRKQSILVLPHLIDPALELQSVLTILIVVLADELRWNVQLLKTHQRVFHASTQQVPESGDL